MKVIKLAGIWSFGLGLLAFFALVSGAYLATPLWAEAEQPWHFLVEYNRLPEDGTPLQLPLYVSRRDAWVQYQEKVLEQVFVRKNPETGKLSIFLPQFRGGRVDYDPKESIFRARCWGLKFDVEGQEIPNEGFTMGEQLHELPMLLMGKEIWVRVEKK
jgi:hypothetical protein